ncbi:MAG: hypothetical protein ABIT05_12000 [Chitinophagaceae bacterium]
MRKSLSKKISIFLSLDRDVLKSYYNVQDSAPLYKRELSHEFEHYIMTAVRTASRSSTINFKINYRNEPDRAFAEPLMYAIRRHFSGAKAVMAVNFENFKRRTYLLLFVSLSVVMICHVGLPLLLKGQESSVHSGLSSTLDVFSWVITWKPIDRLIFYWNPFLKDIAILEKLEKGEVVMNEVVN